MNNTALGAENKKEQTLNFISEAHEKFYYEKLKEVRYQEVYHKALCYCLGISDDTRRNINSIYDFKTGCVKTECLHEGWQTSGSMKVVRMAFNLYCNGSYGDGLVCNNVMYVELKPDMLYQLTFPEEIPAMNGANNSYTGVSDDKMGGSLLQNRIPLWKFWEGGVSQKGHRYLQIWI